MIERANGAAKRKPIPSDTSAAHSASPVQAPSSSENPAQKRPARQRRALSALIGPGGQATDQPSRKPAARRGESGAFMAEEAPYTTAMVKPPPLRFSRNWRRAGAPRTDRAEETMPLFAYRCRAGGEIRDVGQRRRDAALQGLRERRPRTPIVADRRAGEGPRPCLDGRRLRRADGGVLRRRELRRLRRRLNRLFERLEFRLERRHDVGRRERGDVAAHRGDLAHQGRGDRPDRPPVRPIAATLVRQIAAMGGDVAAFAPPNVVAALKAKFQSLK